MERSSDKHSPLVDEAMSAEARSLVEGAPVESRSQEKRLQEDGGADDDNTRSARHDTDSAALPDADERSELARHLRPSAFPADRGALVAVATSEHAPERIIDQLRSLPDGVTFANVQAVWEALGGAAETRP